MQLGIHMALKLQNNTMKEEKINTKECIDHI